MELTDHIRHTGCTFSRSTPFVSGTTVTVTEAVAAVIMIMTTGVDAVSDNAIHFSTPATLATGRVQAVR